MRILVADDAAFMRMRLRSLLEKAGYVAEAANGQEAVARYGLFAPHAVLMDITMPEMDGIAATQAIRTQDADGRVIVVSALGQHAMVVAAPQAGARDVVVKPYQPDRILAALEQ